jgi:hypothetical protein
MALFSVVMRRGAASAAINTGNLRLRQVQIPAIQHRSFMSTQALSSAEEESHMLLILGKPGGGKGTISGKILKVCMVDLNGAVWGVWGVHANDGAKGTLSYSIMYWLFSTFDLLVVCFRTVILNRNDRTFPSSITFLRETCSVNTSFKKRNSA